MNAIIIYDTKFGNTGIAAEAIAEGLIEIEDLEIVVRNIDDVDISDLSEYDNIFFGTPNHDGLATERISKLIEDAGQLNFNTAVFDLTSPR